MNSTILQVPIEKSLRDKATLAARSQGFSSLQEAVRIFLNQLSFQSLRVTFEPQSVQLSPKAIKRYSQMSQDVKSGKTIANGFDNIDEISKYLNS